MDTVAPSLRLDEQAVYAPALVVFVGGTPFQGTLAVGAVAASVGCFRLAPTEVYRPTYQVSRSSFAHINRTNAVIAPANIVNVYNTINVTQTCPNQQVPDTAVVVVAKPPAKEVHVSTPGPVVEPQ